MLAMIGHWIVAWIIGWGGIGLLVTTAAWMLWYFTPAILLRFKSLILHVAVGLTVFTATSTYFFTSGFNKGYAVAIHAIAAQDAKAVTDANTARGTVSDCFNSGGAWDVAAAACVRGQ